MHERAGVVVLAALVPLAVLVVDPAGWYSFGPSKWLVVSVLVPAGAGALFARRTATVAPRPTVAFAALVALFAVAALFGDDPLYSWLGTPERHFGVVTWALCLVAFVAGQTLDQRDTGAVAAGVTLAALGLGALATAEALGFEPSVFDVAGRLTATFGSAAYLGAATALLLPAAVGVALDARVPDRLRLAAALATPLLAVACIGAGARAAWVGLAAAAFATAVATRDVLCVHARRTAGGAAVAAVALLAVFALTPAGDRVADVFDSDRAGGAGRLDEWRIATRVIAADPLLGTGPEGYRIAFGHEVDASYEREHGRDPLPDRAHSAPLDVAVTGGVPALLAWLALLTTTGALVLGRLRTARPAVAGIAAGVVAYFAAQLLLFPVSELDPVAWLLAGLVVGDASTDRRTVRIPRAASVVLGAVAVVALGAGALDLAADRQARTAVDRLADGDARGAADAAARATDLRPDVLRLRLLEARALVAADRGLLAALAAVDRGLDLSPDDPVARLDRVEYLVARARATHVPAHAETARRAAEALLDDDPHNAGAWLQLGSAEHEAGDRAAARRAWERAADLAPRSAAPLIDLALLAAEGGDVDEALAVLEQAEAADPADPRVDEARRLVAAAE